MRILLLNLLLLLPCVAADKDFNGRWDITVHDNARKRAWWLEVKGAGTLTISGSFVGAPGGQMDKIPEIKLEDSELQFTFKSVPNRGTGVYRAKFVQGKLEGTLEGVPVPLKWTGVRAPKLSGGDPKKWHDGTPVELFNSKDLTGWTLLHPEKKKGWNVANGIAKNEAG